MFVIPAWALTTIALLYPHSIHAQCKPIKQIKEEYLSETQQRQAFMKQRK